MPDHDLYLNLRSLKPRELDALIRALDSCPRPLSADAYSLSDALTDEEHRRVREDEEVFYGPEPTPLPERAPQAPSPLLGGNPAGAGLGSRAAGESPRSESGGGGRA
jgi:hypothetical protein